MKRVFTLVCSVLLCVGCTYSNEQKQESISSSNAETQLVDGYQELVAKVYISDNIKRDFQTKLYQYGVSTGDEAFATKKLMEWMGAGAQESSLTGDGSTHTQLVLGQMTGEALVNKNGTWITLDNKSKAALVSLYSSLLADSADNTSDNSKFKDSISFSSDEALDKVKKFIEIFQLNFSDYDYVIATVSKQSLEAYLPQMKKNPMKEGTDFSIYDNQAEDLCVISVYPKIEGYRVIDSNVMLGSGEQLNVTYGTNFTFAITESGIIHADMLGVYLPTQAGEQILVSYAQAIEAIKEKYKETLLENPVYIENIQIEYAPLPIEQNEGQLYEARSYQPLVAVTAKEENRLEKFYLNPLNWKEVQ